MNYKIVKDKTYLSQPTKPTTLEEGEKIGKHLIAALDKFGGIGLAANQIGIDKNVVVIHAKKDEDPIVLINPRVVESSPEKIIYLEGCLSIPGKTCWTVRNRSVTIAADNLANEREFKGDVAFTDEDYRNGKYLNVTDLGLLETMCVQHELDHLDGTLITDPSRRFIPQTAKKIKIGRNEKVMVKNIKTQETQFIKNKKALELVDAGGWEII